MDGEEKETKKLGLNDEPKDVGSFEALPAPSSHISTRTSKNPRSRQKTPDYSKIPEPGRVMRSVFWLAIIVIVGFGAGWVGARQENHGSTLTSAQTKEIVSGKEQLVSAIAADVSPSVVSVDAQGTTDTTDIFGNMTPTQEESAGTGVIISSSGYILTNRHVIPTGTTSVTVVLADGTTINNVQVVGTTSSSDPLDVAILKINNPPEALQPALLGDSSKAQIGDQVVAIGNALGQFQNTVTSGIISGRGRTIQAGDPSDTTSEDLQDLFQTDAAINEGNSGGPLINSGGQVIGLNTATASSAQNIGFSIPINDIEGIIKGVFSTGKIERPYLGVYYVTIDAGTQKQYSLSVSSGAYIPQNQNGQASILPNSPASAAGLQPGDIITAVNSVPVNSNNSLSSLIDENQVGTKISLSILRNGSNKTINITVGSEPSTN